MYSLLNSVRSTFQNREQIIKESLLANLSENVKEIQYEFKESDQIDDPHLELSDATNSLCTTLEAIFLHGLKDSFLRQTINVIGNEVDRRPEPNFWPPLLVFSHKQVIEQIQNLSQISSDIGCCRAWIRQAINDQLLVAYFSNFRRDASAINPYYKRVAFLRDSDCMEMAEQYLNGIELCCTFRLPYNTSLLNHWPTLPLQMAGIYSPPLRSCPVVAGVDVASGLSAAEEVMAAAPPIPIAARVELFSQSISNSPFGNANFANNSLQDRLERELDDDGSSDVKLLLEKIDQLEKQKAQRQQTEPNTADLAIEVGADLTSVVATPESPSQQPVTPLLSRSDSMTQSITSSTGGGLRKSQINRQSFNTLWTKHTNEYSTNLNETWQSFRSSLATDLEDQEKEQQDQKEQQDKTTPTTDEILSDFIVITPGCLSNLSHLKEMVEQTCRLAREQGLDAQNFVCKACSQPLVLGLVQANLCAFSGAYYCDKCIHPDLHLIPAKIINNWDFQKYTVSKMAAQFLAEYQFQPFIDLKLLNSAIYQAVEHMAAIQSQRIQLNFLRAYLFTCGPDSYAKLQKLVWTKEYLCEHIHRYAIADFYSIAKDQLSGTLKAAIDFARSHVFECTRCAEKGFVCELCQDDRVLYPFQLDVTFRCCDCGSIYHQECLDASMPCPKCERKRRREYLQSLSLTDQPLPPPTPMLQTPPPSPPPPDASSS